jgi:hypothetical protein
MLGTDSWGKNVLTASDFHKYEQYQTYFDVER